MENLARKKINHLVFAALIGSIYATLAVLLAPISYGQIQVRVAEALTVLPFFSSYSIWGLFVGCIVANIFGGNGPIDIIFGSLATLIAAIITYYIGKSNIRFKKYLAPLPPVIINAVVIGFVLNYTLHYPLLITMLWIGLGEAVSCYVIGLAVLTVFEKNSALMKYLKA